MSDFTPAMIITGERTVPGIWHENYWFRRHEVVYLRVLDLVRNARVLEAGCGEGYGANLLSQSADVVVALDYDPYATDHAHATYPHVGVVRGNLVALPFADQSFDVVVSLQTIEHLWDQEEFVSECMRTLTPGGTLIVSTPNTLTFPPGNIYHPKELTADQLHQLIAAHGEVVGMEGLHHGRRIRDWEAQRGSLIDAQIAGAFETWSTQTEEAVRSVTVDDFDFGTKDLEQSLDLIVTAQRS